jgi:hypothetical protein
MKPPEKAPGDGWVLRWTPAATPPPTADDVLLVVRDKDGKLLYCMANHYPETEPNEEDDGKPFWSFTSEIHWPKESLVKWSLLPPLS